MKEIKQDKDKKYAALCHIVRAQHLAWREAIEHLFPGMSPEKVVATVREIEGRQTAEAYAPGIDMTRPVAPQVAEALVAGRQAVGEAPVVEVTPDGEEAFINASGCPWYEIHKRLGALEEDRSACDAWFQSTVEHMNEALGTRLKVETCESRASGDHRCRRRLFVEPLPEFFE